MKERVTAVDSPGQKRDAGALQLIFHELGVHWYVFEDEDAKRILGHATIQSQKAGWQPPRRSPILEVTTLKVVEVRRKSSTPC
jgi:hypothetical protein